MPTTPAIIARNQRILAGHAAGASVHDHDRAEAVDPAIVRRVFRAAGAFIFGRQAGVRSL